MARPIALTQIEAEDYSGPRPEPIVVVGPIPAKPVSAGAVGVHNLDGVEGGTVHAVLKELVARIAQLEDAATK